MSTFEDVMSLAVNLSLSDRERLARALGVQVAAPRSTLPLSTGNDLSKTNPAAWRQRERGHAVLATDQDEGPVSPGPEAIRGMWKASEVSSPVHEITHSAAHLPPGTPVLVHTSVVDALARDDERVRDFWAKPPVEVRLATGTYLKMLEDCATAAEQLRMKAFVQPFAVLSLGPMASSKAVELMLNDQSGELQALDALIAATALAHEIPLVSLDPAGFLAVPGLLVVGI